MNRAWIVAALATGLIACGGERAEQTTGTVAETATQASESAQARLQGMRQTDGAMTAEEIAQQRQDHGWRSARSFLAGSQPPGTSPAEDPQVNVRFRRAPDSAPSGTSGQTPAGGESLQNVNWQRVDELPVTVPMRGDIAGPSVLKAQVLLDRVSYSPGVIDGHWGKNSEIAAYWFQRQNGLEATGDIDERTYRLLVSRAASAQAVQSYTVTEDDANGPFTNIPEDIYEKADLDCLCYENVGELLAEKFHTTRETIALLNGGVDPATLTAGRTILVPNVQDRADGPKDVGRIVVSVGGNYLHAFDGAGKLLFHAPTTVGSQYDPSPTETLRLTGLAWDPTFHYQPTLFSEVPDDEPEAMLQAGPNSPVGVVWMQLSRDNFGIHGTSDPASIGYASSHGCIRLTNWNARQLGMRVPQGTTVEFVDT